MAIMPRKRKAPVAEFSFAAWRGVPCFDFNMCLLLAHAPMEQAIEAFVKTFDAKRTRDVVGRDIAHRPPAYLAYQFKGHPWSVFDQFLLALDTRWTTPDDARKFSKTLGDKVLLFPISDTAGVYEYTMYDKGKLFERVFNENEAIPSSPTSRDSNRPGERSSPRDPPTCSSSSTSSCASRTSSSRPSAASPAATAH